MGRCASRRSGGWMGHYKCKELRSEAWVWEDFEGLGLRVCIFQGVTWSFRARGWKRRSGLEARRGTGSWEEGTLEEDGSMVMCREQGKCG